MGKRVAIPGILAIVAAVLASDHRAIAAEKRFDGVTLRVGTGVAEEQTRVFRLNWDVIEPRMPAIIEQWHRTIAGESAPR